MKLSAENVIDFRFEQLKNLSIENYVTRCGQSNIPDIFIATDKMTNNMFKLKILIDKKKKVFKNYLFNFLFRLFLPLRVAWSQSN